MFVFFYHTYCLLYHTYLPCHTCIPSFAYPSLFTGVICRITGLGGCFVPVPLCVCVRGCVCQCVCACVQSYSCAYECMYVLSGMYESSQDLHNKGSALLFPDTLFCSFQFGILERPRPEPPRPESTRHNPVCLVSVCPLPPLVLPPRHFNPYIPTESSCPLPHPALTRPF